MPDSQIDQTQISGSATADPRVVEIVRAALKQATTLLDGVVHRGVTLTVPQVRVGATLDPDDPGVVESLAKLIALEALKQVPGEEDRPQIPPGLQSVGQGGALPTTSSPFATGDPPPQAILLDPSFSGGVRGKLEKGGYKRQGGHSSLKEIDKKVTGLLGRAHLHGATVERLSTTDDAIGVTITTGPHGISVWIYSAEEPPGDAIGPHASDGALTGPVRFYPTLDGAGELVGGRIDVDEDLHRTEIVRALGNEVDLIAGLLLNRAVTAEALRREMRAEQMQGARGSTASTLQDQATAAELEQAWRASFEGAKTRLTQARKPKPGEPPPPPLTDQEIRIQQVSDLNAKLSAWGLLKADAEIGSRIDFLEQHLSHEVLNQLVGALHFHAHKDTGAALASQDFTHLLKPTAKLNNAMSFVSGGHQDMALMRWVQTQPQLALVEVKRATVGGLVLRKYAQLKWLDTATPKPGAGDADYPSVAAGVVTYDTSKWARSGDDKTTVEDMLAFLKHAESAWGNFVAAASGTPTMGDKGLWRHTSTGGVPVMGYAFDLGGGTFDFASVFPDASQF